MGGADGRAIGSNKKTIRENPCLEFQELRLQEIRALHQTFTWRSHFGATERKAGLLWIGSFFKSILGARTQEKNPGEKCSES